MWPTIAAFPLEVEQEPPLNPQGRADDRAWVDDGQLDAVGGGQVPGRFSASSLLLS